jgi:hypothetical protein
VVIKQNTPVIAVSLLLQFPDLKVFSDSLVLDKDKESFQEHIRTYVDIYLRDYPFEISRTTQYTSEPEAIIKARKDIEKGEIIYLGGTQASFIREEAPDLSNYLYETCKPLPKSRPEKTSRYQLRSIRGEIPLKKSILTLMKRRHEELYGYSVAPNEVILILTLESSQVT